MSKSELIHKVLKQYWGYDTFRPLQEEIILSILEKNDTLALLPTGGGKSICFQVPTMALDGLCLVVSPLISLMQDQVMNLQKKGIKAVALSSANTRRENDILLDNCIYGGVKFLYLSPERLKSEMFLERFKKMNISILAIDESHCISQWGYDFRPEYLKIAELRKYIPEVPVIALTATATPPVVQDIQEKLEFSEHNVLQKSFERDNLAYFVEYEEAKIPKLLRIIQKVGGSGIVYLRSRNRTGQMAKELRANGISAESYHAGLKQTTRKQRQDNWVRGEIQVICATNAFGMGIDKPDVRWVVHLDLPDSLEAYFQEAGRAGRDEKKAFAITLYDKADIAELMARTEAGFPKLKEVETIYKALGNYLQLPEGSGKDQSFGFDLFEFARRYDRPLQLVYNALKVLEHHGYIALSEAIHQPSKVMLNLKKDNVYHLTASDTNEGKLVEVLLRSHSGLFDGLVSINERNLSKRLGWEPGLTTKTLHSLHQKNSIEYIEQSDSPKVCFTEERLPLENLLFDTKLYNFRKERAFESARAVVSYLEKHTCRSNQLVEYFGERNARPCGICDICLAQKDSSPSIEMVSELILDRLKTGPIELSKIENHIKGVRSEDIHASLEWLSDNGSLVIDCELISLP